VGSDARGLALRDQTPGRIEQVGPHPLDIYVKRIANVIEGKWPSGISPAHPNLRPASQDETVSRPAARSTSQAANGVHQDRKAERSLSREPAERVRSLRREHRMHRSPHACQGVRPSLASAVCAVLCHRELSQISLRAGGQQIPRHEVPSKCHGIALG